MPNAPSTKSQDLPTPDQTVSGNNTLDGAGKNSFAAKAANYRPKNVFMEVVAATVSRFAARLIDLTTGKAYSANELISYVEAGLAPNLNTVGYDLGSGGVLQLGVYPTAKQHGLIYRKSGSNIGGPLVIELPSAANSFQ